MLKGDNYPLKYRIIKYLSSDDSDYLMYKFLTINANTLRKTHN